MLGVLTFVDEYSTLLVETWKFVGIPIWLVEGEFFHQSDFVSPRV